MPPGEYDDAADLSIRNWEHGTVAQKSHNSAAPRFMFAAYMARSGTAYPVSPAKKYGRQSCALEYS